MEDYKEKIMEKANSVDQQSKFFTFSKPFTDSIDDGTFFTKFSGILYYVIAALFLILPLYIAYEGIDNNIFDAPFKYVFLALVGFAGMTISSWISFQIFLNRRNQIENLDRNKGYLSSAIASNFIRTMGECIGIFHAIVGTSLSILGLFMNDADNVLSALNLEGQGGGIEDVIFFPIVAFFIILFSRFLSELINALPDIARNTKR